MANNTIEKTLNKDINSLSDRIDTLIRTGVGAIRVKQGGVTNAVSTTVTFTTPFPDVNYSVAITLTDAWADWPEFRYYIKDKTRTSFTIYGCDMKSGTATNLQLKFDWMAVYRTKT